MDQIHYNRMFARTQKSAIQFFDLHNKKQLSYHNLQHTQYVVNKTLEIAAHYILTDEELMILYIAAWFHDTGYLLTDPKKHEAKSVEVMRTFAKELGLQENVIEHIARCIMATQYPRKPADLLEEIICDADTFNIGTKDFSETNKRMFREIQGFRKDKLSKSNFDNETIHFMDAHKYYTGYCSRFLKQGKNQNKKHLITIATQKPHQ